METTVQLSPFADADMDLLRTWLTQPHVAPWYESPADWLYEVSHRHGEFAWIRHFLVRAGETPIGFCQYYLYEKGGEDWHGDLPLAGTYSLDYLIGEAAFLRRGFGKQLVAALLSEIRRQPDAKRVIVQPDPANHASCGLLQACGFALVPQNGLYLYTL